VKHKARHAALESLARMIMPSMLEDIKQPEKKAEKKLEVEIEKEDEDDKEKKGKKKMPMMAAMSITRLIAERDSLKKKDEPKKEFKVKK